MLKGLLDVQLSAGDYYLCAPPALSFPKDSQQGQTTPQDSEDTQLPNTTPPDSHSDAKLAQLSPNILTQPQPEPTFIGKIPRQQQHLSFKPLGPVGHHPISPTILSQLLPDTNPLVLENDTIIPFSPPPNFSL